MSAWSPGLIALCGQEESGGFKPCRHRPRLFSGSAEGDVVDAVDEIPMPLLPLSIVRWVYSAACAVMAEGRWGMIPQDCPWER